MVTRVLNGPVDNRDMLRRRHATVPRLFERDATRYAETAVTVTVPADPVLV
jgi:hypothetical protein